MIFKNQRTAYFRLRGLTTHANEPQDQRSCWTKIHQIYIHGNFSLEVLTQQSVLWSIHTLSNERGGIKKESNIGET